ncbi:hypothetical protein DFA_06929 [Cavenderia fasciculata]|uniref:Uncharacterized protein n=1 Tax=Cavenderia fasciculata TaxID=261658 RepID=F4PX24_CACFS|nr:uncharacterized protein DFA_06929 [Cavenderia fasciculata]EGG19827.1 hypothetical protein DFA_06929 [Cavenderia fasciculata]|eukprot:XP_004358173.1 hypothetical protein DFA_06929 [Cavenderia fasciculata]
MEPEISIEPPRPCKNNTEQHINITVVNYLSQGIVVFLKSGAPPLHINYIDRITTFSENPIKQNIICRVDQQPPTSSNLPVTGEIGFLIIFVAVNKNDEEVPRYVRLLDRRVQNGSTFNVLPRHYLATMDTDRRLFDQHFQPESNDIGGNPASGLYVMTFSDPDQEETKQFDPLFPIGM